MKKLVTLLSLAVLSLGFPVSSFAAKKAAATPAVTAAAATPSPTSEAKKPAKPVDPNKPLAMYVKVDTIDAAGKTFTHTNKKDGKVVKFVVTDKTDIKNGEAAAKFEDIKVGDTVSGLRIKKSDTQYEVVKITKFSVVVPKPKKADAAAKPDEKKPQ